MQRFQPTPQRSRQPHLNSEDTVDYIPGQESMSGISPHGDTHAETGATFDTLDPGVTIDSPQVPSNMLYVDGQYYDRENALDSEELNQWYGINASNRELRNTSRTQRLALMLENSDEDTYKRLLTEVAQDLQNWLDQEGFRAEVSFKLDDYGDKFAADLIVRDLASPSKINLVGFHTNFLWNAQDIENFKIWVEDYKEEHSND